MDLVMCCGYIALGFVLISLTESLCGAARPLRSAFFGMLCGVLTLIAANSLSAISGAVIPITPAALLISSIGGVPGALLTIFAFLFF